MNPKLIVMREYLIITALLVAVSGLATNEIRLVSAESCEDIKGKESWGSESHGDNNPSAKQFFNDMDENTFCEHAEKIDHMKYEGAIREDTKHDWDWFEDTMVFMSAGEETQEKLRDLYENPDDGKMNLEAYEFLDAIY